MPEILRFTLLGSPRVLVGDQVLTNFTTAKAQALLFYLVVTAHAAPHSRDALAMLLWDEMTDTQARHNLRSMLSDLRRLVGDYLQIERQTVAFKGSMPHWIDVAVLRRDLTPGRSPVDLATRQAAVDLYAGEFLSGFYVHHAPAFETWVIEQREHVHIRVVETLFGLARDYIERTDYAHALTANRRLLVLEPWSEPAHRQQMLILDLRGERSAALTQYEVCQRMLLAEFGVEPLPETTALYEQIRAGKRIAQLRDARPVLEPERTHAVGAPAPTAGIYQGGVVIDPAASSSDTELPAQIVGHGLPRRIELYDRQAELGLLHEWILEDGCRVVGIFGIGGQGKTALAVAFAHTLVESTSRIPDYGKAEVRGVFTRILWRSLLNAPPLAEVLHEWLSVIADQQVATLPTSLDQQLGLLLDYLRQQRCLLILDNLESVLQSGKRSGAYLPGYEGYGQLIRRMAEEQHRSCLLVTSRERPQDVTRLHEDTTTIRVMYLAGLPADAGQRMLQARGLAGASTDLGALVQHYSGNPLGLNLVAETIRSIFAGDVHAFLQAETLVFDDIRDVLDQQFARLSPLECDVLLWLAVVREPVSFIVLRDLLGQPPASRPLLEAVRSLQRRSLLEHYESSFGLQNVVLEYTTDLLIEYIIGELVGDMPTRWHADTPTRAPDAAIAFSRTHSASVSHLNRYALMLAQAKEYVRASQTRLLLQPVAEGLVNHWGRAGAARQLHQLLGGLRATTLALGYAAANLLHLLLHLGVDLRGADFSGLFFRQLYVRGASLPQTNFAQAALIESAFTEPFGLVYAAAFSPDDRYLAAGMSDGSIYLWRTADQQLVRVIQAHSQEINELTFGQRTTPAGTRELVLASASDDMRVGVWFLGEGEAAHEARSLMLEHQGIAVTVGLSADGQRLTVVADNGQMTVWDISTPTQARVLQQFASIPTRLWMVGFRADGALLVVGSRDGRVQLWDMATGELQRVLDMPTRPIESLALRGDGQLLATGERNGHLCLWSLPDGRLHQVIETKAGLINAIVFSQDGTLLATTHGDFAVRLWQIDAHARAQVRHTLLGHTSVIWSVRFGRQPLASAALPQAGDQAAGQHLLVSGSNDQTVRVWHTTTGQTLSTLRGQPRGLVGVAVGRVPLARGTTDCDTQPSVDWQMAAVGYDQCIHVWPMRGAQVSGQRRSIAAQRGQIAFVALSPDGSAIAIAAADRAISLWDSVSGQLLLTFAGHTKDVNNFAFHPDGNLLASSGINHIVRLWDLAQLRTAEQRVRDGARDVQPVAVLATAVHAVSCLAFSPDGRMLASVGAGRVVQLWDLTQPHVPELLQMQKTVEATAEQDMFTVAFSPDGATLACGGNRLIHLWDLTGASTAPRILRQHTSWVHSIAFSPDGATLASASGDCTVCVWEVASGRLRAVLQGHTEAVIRVAFSPDGAVLVSCSLDGTINIWDSQTGARIDTLLVEGPYEGMNITDVTGITEAQKVALMVLGAIERD